MFRIGNMRRTASANEPGSVRGRVRSDPVLPSSCFLVIPILTSSSSFPFPHDIKGVLLAREIIQRLSTSMEYTKPPVDESLLFKMNDEDFTFIKALSGIEDVDALKKHIIAVQTKAYDLYGHMCIRRFSFTRPKISAFPMYEHALELGRNGILLDIGCCFGTDIRKCWSDGIPARNLIASDLRPGRMARLCLRMDIHFLIVFWNLGHELFQSTPDSFPVAFLAGDALDPNFLEPTMPPDSSSEVPDFVPPLSSLTSLTPLRGHVSVIHITAVFHLFFEPQQLQLARALAGLLSPAPGSLILGSHVGRRTKGFNERAIGSGGHHMFCHSPESWCELWEEVFPKGMIEVKAELKQRPEREESYDIGNLVWSVTRL
ncbi:Methyltransferase ausD [Mycena sanguinolenta]|uniref:Methyltransferase ausD n=1 Tax=Mycena sanguinolenta TaxID=230812 RepID=A0A8H6ZH45_9AGAR|nr:Methyltransferase ausD [Mycena sanguinolenta]